MLPAIPIRVEPSSSLMSKLFGWNQPKSNRSAVGSKSSTVSVPHAQVMVVVRPGSTAAAAVGATTASPGSDTPSRRAAASISNDTGDSIGISGPVPSSGPSTLSSTEAGAGAAGAGVSAAEAAEATGAAAVGTSVGAVAALTDSAAAAGRPASAAAPPPGTGSVTARGAPTEPATGAVTTRSGAAAGTAGFAAAESPDPARPPARSVAPRPAPAVTSSGPRRTRSAAGLSAAAAPVARDGWREARADPSPARLRIPPGAAADREDEPAEAALDSESAACEESGVSATATPAPPSTPPTPSAAASAPTRPTARAAMPTRGVRAAATRLFR